MNSDSLDIYFKTINNLNPLKKEEELELADLAQQGDAAAINKLIKHNLKIVVTIANKNVGRGILVDDLIQQGNLGLYEAALRYNSTHNVRFSTFAGTRILKSINQLIDSCGRIVRIPVNQEYQRYLNIKNGKDVENISPVKIDDFIGDDSDETKASRLLAVTADVDKHYENKHSVDQANVLLGNLESRDRRIVQLYYGIGVEKELPTKEIAEELGLTQIRICQILNSAKKKMRGVLA